MSGKKVFYPVPPATSSVVETPTKIFSKLKSSPKSPSPTHHHKYLANNYYNKYSNLTSSDNESDLESNTNQQSNQGFNSEENSNYSSPTSTTVASSSASHSKKQISKLQDQISDREDEKDNKITVLDLPDTVLETIFSYLPIEDVQNCIFVCSIFHNVLADEDSEVWKNLCHIHLEKDSINSDLISSLTSYKLKLRAYFYGWNQVDCSRNIFVKPGGFTLHRNPVAQSTDGARGRKGFSKGRHSWEIMWEGPLGTVALVGVATKRAQMRGQGYVALLGQDEESWGWNIVENVLLHNGDTHGNYPLINNAPKYQIGEKIRVILDMDDKTLSFERNYEFLGVAFHGLPNQELLYPAVSAVYGNTEISLVYLGPPYDG